MLSIFRTNQLVLGILLLLYAFLVRSSTFFFPEIWEPNSPGLLQQVLYDFVGTQGLLADSIALIIVFINALIINYLVYQHELNKKYNLFPGLFYILLASSSSDFLHLSSFHLANTFLLLSLLFLFKITTKSTSTKSIFNTGLSIAIASLFSFSYWGFFIWAIVAISILQSFRLKKVIILLSGFITPWFYVFLYYLWNEKVDVLWYEYILKPFKFTFFQFESNLSDYSTLTFWSIVLLLLLFTVGQSFMKQKFIVKKKISLLLWLLLFSVVLLLFSINPGIENLLIFSIASSVFLALAFTRMATTTAEALHLLLMGLVIFLQYQALFPFLK